MNPTKKQLIEALQHREILLVSGEWRPCTGFNWKGLTAANVQEIYDVSRPMRN